MNRIAGVVLGSLIAVNAFAADVSGKWKGKVEVDFAAIKKQMSKQFANMTPEQSKQIESGMKMGMEAVKNAVFDLTIAKDGTYTMKTPALMGQASREEKGKWTLKGNKITMNDPKAASGPKSVTVNCQRLSINRNLPIKITILLILCPHKRQSVSLLLPFSALRQRPLRNLY